MPVILAVAAFIAARQNRKRVVLLFATSAAIYFRGAFLTTVAVNVPTNEALAQVTVPSDTGAAREIWQAYSTPLQFWHTLTTVVSGFALMLTGFAIFS